jgi:hypothetical protein
VTGDECFFVKTYAAPGGWRAMRAFRMGRALARAGFGVAPAAAAARRGGAGLLVTREVSGEELGRAIAHNACRPAAKRALLRRVGTEIARLHRAGFVHGDLVPSNVLVTGARLVFLDNDRTRRSRLLVTLVGRRNLVQLGRLVIPGVTLTDRARVLAAYAAGRGLPRRRRQRLARWVVRKVSARRCAIDGLRPDEVARAGFRTLMRSGGPFDPTRVETAPGSSAPRAGEGGT